MYLTTVASLKYSPGQLEDSSTDKIEASLERQEHFFQFQDSTDALLYHILLPVCLRVTDTHSRAAEKSMIHGNEVVPQDSAHLTPGPCYQRGSVCQDPAGHRTIRRPPDHGKENRTEVIRTCLPFTRSSQIVSQGTKGGRRQGRQKQRWEDNISEWTGLEFAKSNGAVENRENNGGNWMCPTRVKEQMKVKEGLWALTVEKRTVRRVGRLWDKTMLLECRYSNIKSYVLPVFQVYIESSFTGIY